MEHLANTMTELYTGSCAQSPETDVHNTDSDIGVCTGYQVSKECTSEMMMKSYRYKQLVSTDPDSTFESSCFKSSIAAGGLSSKDTPYSMSKCDVIDGCTRAYAINVYGEDTTMHVKYSKEGSPTLFVMGVFDGHGNNAHVSRAVACAYNDYFAEHYDNITMLPFTDHGSFKSLLHKMCATVEDAISPDVTRGGGSTATIVGVVENGAKRIVFNMNMGDSHAYMRRNTVTQQISVDHSVDNKDAYTEYCAINLERGIKPAPAVYNRINCDKLGSAINGVRNHEGKIEPIPIFDVTEDGKVSFNIKARDYITKYTEPGGVQSIRQYVGIVNGVTTVLPGYEHINHGSTLMGDLQFVRGHGDLKQTQDHGFLHIHDINIYSVEPEDTVDIVCGSDGLWDLFWTCEIMDVIDDTAELSVRNIKKLIVERSQVGKFAKKGYRTLVIGLHIKAQWDDVSFVSFVSPPLSS